MIIERRLAMVTFGILAVIVAAVIAVRFLH